MVFFARKKQTISIKYAYFIGNSGAGTQNVVQPASTTGTTWAVDPAGT